MSDKTGTPPLSVDVETLNFGEIQCQKTLQGKYVPLAERESSEEVPTERTKQHKSRNCATKKLKITNVSDTVTVPFQIFSTTPGRYKTTPKNVTLRPQTSTDIQVDLEINSFRIVGTQAKHFRDYLFLRGGNCAEKKIAVRGKIVPVSTNNERKQESKAPMVAPVEHILETEKTLEEENKELRNQVRLLTERVKSLTHSLATVSPEKSTTSTHEFDDVVHMWSTDDGTGEEACRNCQTMKHLLDSQKIEIETLSSCCEYLTDFERNKTRQNNNTSNMNVELAAAREKIDCLIHDSVSKYDNTKEETTITISKPSVQEMLQGNINWCEELERRWTLQTHASVIGAVANSLRGVVSRQHEAIFQLQEFICSSMQMASKTKDVAEKTDERLLDLLNSISNGTHGMKGALKDMRESPNVSSDGPTAASLQQLNDFTLSSTAALAASRRASSMFSSLQAFTSEGISLYRDFRLRISNMMNALDRPNFKKNDAESPVDSTWYAEDMVEFRGKVSHLMTNLIFYSGSLSNSRRMRKRPGDKLNSRSDSFSKLQEWLQHTGKKYCEVQMEHSGNTVDEYTQCLEEAVKLVIEQRKCHENTDLNYSKRLLSRLLGPTKGTWNNEKVSKFFYGMIYAAIKALGTEKLKKNLQESVKQIDLMGLYEENEVFSELANLCRLPNTGHCSQSTRMNFLCGVLSKYFDIQCEYSSQSVRSAARDIIHYIEDWKKSENVKRLKNENEYLADQLSTVQTEIQSLHAQVQEEREVRERMQNHYSEKMLGLDKKIQEEKWKRYEFKDLLNTKDEQINTLTRTIQSLQTSDSLEDRYAVRHLKDELLNMTAVSLKWQTYANGLQRRIRNYECHGNLLTNRRMHFLPSQSVKDTEGIFRNGPHLANDETLNDEANFVSHLLSEVKRYRNDNSQWQLQIQKFLQDSHSSLRNILQNEDASQQLPVWNLVQFLYSYCFELEKKCLHIQKQSVISQSNIVESVSQAMDRSLREEKAFIINTVDSLCKQLQHLVGKINLIASSIHNSDGSKNKFCSELTMPDLQPVMTQLQHFLSSNDDQSSQDVVLSKLLARKMEDMIEKLHHEYQQRLSSIQAEASKADTLKLLDCKFPLTEVQNSVARIEATLKNIRAHLMSNVESSFPLGDLKETIDRRLKNICDSTQRNIEASLMSDLVKISEHSMGPSTPPRPTSDASTQTPEFNKALQWVNEYCKDSSIVPKRSECGAVTHPTPLNEAPFVNDEYVSRRQAHSPSNETFNTASSIVNTDASQFGHQAKEWWSTVFPTGLQITEFSGLKLTEDQTIRLLLEVEQAQRNAQQAYRSEAHALKRLNSYLKESKTKEFEDLIDRNEILRQNRILRSYVHTLSQQTYDKFATDFPELSGYSVCSTSMLKLHRELALRKRNNVILEGMLKHQTENLARIRRNAKPNSHLVLPCQCQKSSSDVKKSRYNRGKAANCSRTSKHNPWSAQILKVSSTVCQDNIEGLLKPNRVNHAHSSSRRLRPSIEPSVSFEDSSPFYSLQPLDSLGSSAAVVGVNSNSTIVNVSSSVISEVIPAINHWDNCGPTLTRHNVVHCSVHPQMSHSGLWDRQDIEDVGSVRVLSTARLIRDKNAVCCEITSSNQEGLPEYRHLDNVAGTQTPMTSGFELNVVSRDDRDLETEERIPVSSYSVAERGTGSSDINDDVLSYHSQSDSGSELGKVLEITDLPEWQEAELYNIQFTAESNQPSWTHTQDQRKNVDRNAPKRRYVNSRHGQPNFALSQQCANSKHISNSIDHKLASVDSSDSDRTSTVISYNFSTAPVTDYIETTTVPSADANELLERREPRMLASYHERPEGTKTDKYTLQGTSIPETVGKQDLGWRIPASSTLQRSLASEMTIPSTNVFRDNRERSSGITFSDGHEPVTDYIETTTVPNADANELLERREPRMLASYHERPEGTKTDKYTLQGTSILETVGRQDLGWRIPAFSTLQRSLALEMTIPSTNVFRDNRERSSGITCSDGNEDGYTHAHTSVSGPECDNLRVKGEGNITQYDIPNSEFSKVSTSGITTNLTRYTGISSIPVIDACGFSTTQEPKFLAPYDERLESKHADQSALEDTSISETVGRQDLDWRVPASSTVQRSFQTQMTIPSEDLCGDNQQLPVCEHGWNNLRIEREDNIIENEIHSVRPPVKPSPQLAKVTMASTILPESKITGDTIDKGIQATEWDEVSFPPSGHSKSSIPSGSSRSQHSVFDVVNSPSGRQKDINNVISFTCFNSEGTSSAVVSDTAPLHDSSGRDESGNGRNQSLSKIGERDNDQILKDSHKTSSCCLGKTMRRVRATSKDPLLLNTQHLAVISPPVTITGNRTVSCPNSSREVESKDESHLCRMGNRVVRTDIVEEHIDERRFTESQTGAYINSPRKRNDEPSSHSGELSYSPLRMKIDDKSVWDINDSTQRLRLRTHSHVLSLDITPTTTAETCTQTGLLFLSTTTLNQASRQAQQVIRPVSKFSSLMATVSTTSKVCNERVMPLNHADARATQNSSGLADENMSGPPSPVYLPKAVNIHAPQSFEIVKGFEDHQKRKRIQFTPQTEQEAVAPRTNSAKKVEHSTSCLVRLEPKSLNEDNETVTVSINFLSDLFKRWTDFRNLQLIFWKWRIRTMKSAQFPLPSGSKGLESCLTDFFRQQQPKTKCSLQRLRYQEQCDNSDLKGGACSELSSLKGKHGQKETSSRSRSRSKSSHTDTIRRSRSHSKPAQENERQHNCEVNKREHVPLPKILPYAGNGCPGRCAQRDYSWKDVPVRRRPQYDFAWLCPRWSCRTRHKELIRVKKLLRVYMNRVKLLRQLVNDDDNFALVKELINEGIQPSSKHEMNIVYSILVQALRRLFGSEYSCAEYHTKLGSLRHLFTDTCGPLSHARSLQQFVSPMLKAVESLKKNNRQKAQELRKFRNRVRNVKNYSHELKIKVDRLEKQLGAEQKDRQKEKGDLTRRIERLKSAASTIEDLKVYREMNTQLFSNIKDILKSVLDENYSAHQELVRSAGTYLTNLHEDYTQRKEQLLSLITPNAPLKQQVEELSLAFNQAILDCKKVEYALGISTASMV